MDLSRFNTSTPSNPGRLTLDPTTGHLVLENSNVNEIIDTNSHNHNQHGYSGPGSDQIGLSQRITQVRKTIVSSQRLSQFQTIHQTTTVVDYFPRQNQLSDHDSLGGPSVIKTEVVTTTRNFDLRPQLVNAPSTISRILYQNDAGTHDHGWINQTQPCSQNLHVVRNSVPNPLTSHSLYPETNPFHHPYPSPDQISNRNNFFDFLRTDQNHTHFPNVSPSDYQQPENITSAPIPQTHEERNEPRSIRVKKTERVLDAEPLSYEFPAENNGSTNYQYPNKRRPKNRIEARYLDRINRICIVDESSSDEDMNVEGDGITHSLPHKKYGPYTCPTCQKTFDTSQQFAAHVGSAHYRFETKDEKRKRQLAKKRRKHLRLFQSIDGLTVMPEASGDEGSEEESDAASRRNEADAGITVREEQAEADAGIPVREEQAEADAGITVREEQAEADAGITMREEQAEADAGITVREEQADAAGTSRQPLIKVKVEPDHGVLFHH